MRVSTENPLTTAWSPQQVEVMHRLHAWTVAVTELNQHLSRWMGLPGPDANAFGQILWAAESGAPLSPAQLSRRIGMTSGATTVLLNRLENAGHIRRSRESTDRRRVTLRPVPASRERAEAFLAVAGTELAAEVRDTGPDELSVVTAVLARMTAAAERAEHRLTERARRSRART